LLELHEEIGKLKLMYAVLLLCQCILYFTVSTFAIHHSHCSTPGSKLTSSTSPTGNLPAGNSGCPPGVSVSGFFFVFLLSCWLNWLPISDHAHFKMFACHIVNKTYWGFETLSKFIWEYVITPAFSCR